jgi:putative copper resistance protein D
MNVVEVALRAVTYVVALLMFGASLFALYARSGADRQAHSDQRGEARPLRRVIWRVQLGCAVATIVAGALWLVVHAAAVAGSPLLRAASGALTIEVARATLFGRAMAWHLGLTVILAATLLLDRTDVQRVPSFPVDAIRVALAAGALAALGWMGHAAATRGFDRYAHLGGDIVHLLAAGAWLGALPLLAVALVRAGEGQSPALDCTALLTTRRFSAIGALCVGALLFTGTVNTWYLVATPPALFGTAYGQLLLVKLALFAAMLALAAHNRFVLTSHLQKVVLEKSEAGRSAMRRIAGNARVEAALGIAILVIVAALGVSVPGAHSEIVWPLPFTFDPDEFAIVRAYPTTYASSPVRYGTAAIAAGAKLYGSNCGACHGAEGRGDGPAAPSLSMRPPSLTSGHALHHHPGDLYWWIARGIPGSPMPRFDDRLTSEQIWQVLTFLHAETDSREAQRLTGRVGDWRPVVAPDFAFEIAGGEQQTLVEQRGARAVLLVLYAYPESLPRLIAFGEAQATFDRAGLRVLAIPSDAKGPAASAADGIDPAILAVCDSNVAAAYSLFLPQPRGHGASADRHAEILIDPGGYVRSVHTGLSPAAVDRVAELARDADRLAREPTRSADVHAHTR